MRMFLWAWSQKGCRRWSWIKSALSERQTKASSSASLTFRLFVYLTFCSLLRSPGALSTQCFYHLRRTHSLLIVDLCFLLLWKSVWLDSPAKFLSCLKCKRKQSGVFQGKHDNNEPIWLMRATQRFVRKTGSLHCVAAKTLKTTVVQFVHQNVPLCSGFLKMD